ncbi:MAG TPA: cytochrome c oxidase subunit II [Gaiellaceae bacterium]|nr:cytochrome c oxidase subunit II [Gaiellaceae bacterium]
MRRKLPSLVLAVLVALATAGVAAAGNGGFAPVAPASPNAEHTRTAYWVIFGFTAAIFLIVEGLLVVFVVKYRQRGRARAVEGAQVHGHTRLEVIWTVIPVVILCVIGIVVFLELPQIRGAPAASNPLDITVQGHQFYWQFDYPNGAHSIGTLHVPVGRVVELKVVSSDVIHSWWVPALGGKIQAIPGRTNHLWFQAQRAGNFEGQCAELCGVYHAAMHATVAAESQQAYDQYVSTTAKQTIGKQIWTGVCATCHGNLGQGGYGPAISSSTLLTQTSGLLGILRNGFDTPARPGAMPPVGDTWTQAETNALAAYVKKHIYKPAPAGATSGG